MAFHPNLPCKLYVTVGEERVLSEVFFSQIKEFLNPLSGNLLILSVSMPHRVLLYIIIAEWLSF